MLPTCRASSISTPTEHRVTPIDYGDVCINYDKAAFGAGETPSSIAALTAPELKGKLVIENPATSSPGLAFMLATIIRFGETGDYTWLDYWRDLRANDVLVVSGWEEAYYSQFSGGSGEGERPLVVSYATSPAAEVFYADPQPAEAPTGVIDDGCFRQIEFVGVLAGAKQPALARKLIDFMLTPEFQADIPLNMFVFPARSNVEPARGLRGQRGGRQPAADDGPGPYRRQSRPVARAVDRRRPSLSTAVAGVHSRGALLLALPALAFVALFFAYPVAALLVRGLAPDGVFDPAATLAVVARPFVLEVAWFTLWQAALSTLLTVLVALPGAYVFARFDFRGRRLIGSLAIVPFVLPTVVVAAAFLALLGPRSPLGIHLEHTLWAILLAHVFYNYAVVLRVVGAAWSQIDPRLEEQARVLGASRWSALRPRHAATPAAGDRISSFGRVPVHLYLVRGDPDPRWRAVRHAGG